MDLNQFLPNERQTKLNKLTDVFSKAQISVAMIPLTTGDADPEAPAVKAVAATYADMMAFIEELLDITKEEREHIAKEASELSHDRIGMIMAKYNAQKGA